MKLLLALFLVFLISCTVQQSAVSNARTAPITQPATSPVQQTIVPETKIPQDIPMQIVQPEPVVKQFENSTSGKIPCMDDCQNNCGESAQIACTQKERAACRASCGEIIENSACVQACTFLSRPDVCKEQFEKFCSAQCARECY